MTNDATRASATALPEISRRNALTLTGAGLVAALAGFASHAAHTAPRNGLDMLNELIDAHTAEYARNDELWERAGELDAEPNCTGVLGRLYRVKSDDCENIYKPIHAYCNEQIDEFYERDLSAQLSIWGNGPAGAENARKIHERYAALVTAKKAELAALGAEKERREIASGFHAAYVAAAASSEALKVIEAQITAFVPASMAAVIRLAQWSADASREGRVDDCCEVILANIGKAALS